MKMPTRDQVVARRAATLAREEADAEIMRLRAEVEKLRRVRDAAAEYRREQESPVKDVTMVVLRRGQLCAALDAAKEAES